MKRSRIKPELMCWLFGHKIIVKEFTGEIIIADTAFDRNVKHRCYQFKRMDFCLRCGKREGE